jgi:hypothetical protein
VYLRNLAKACTKKGNPPNDKGHSSMVPIQGKHRDMLLSHKIPCHYDDISIVDMTCACTNHVFPYGVDDSCREK